MTKTEIEPKFKAILARLGHDDASMDIPFRMNSIDSLDAVEIMIECEQDFNILISDQEMAECKNLKDLLALISARV
jgi:acyl carrier protein